MKLLRILPIIIFCFCITTISAQQKQYTVNGQTYTLTTEVEGPLTLLWTTVNGEYRYFIKKGEAITELKNTKTNRDYQEEYKESLKVLTIDSPMTVDKVKLTRTSLLNFVNEYNKKVDSNFTPKEKGGKLKTRLGAFVGYSNTAYFVNPDNTFLPTFGIDFELIELENLKRHSVVAQFEQTIGNSDYDFNKSEFSLNYRFKFVKSSTIDIYANVKFASYVYVSRDVLVVGEGNDDDELLKGSGGDLRAPGAFGIGADIALGKGFLTLNYIDIFALGIEQGDEFPINLAVGYKINL
ncbi:hypothetical protein [Patiriisocius hiemis]|uniref:Outer membrane protein beta-barrel domain-containing protein n=1 Tax=Patiriisocius hiemis TaxID=3075604 RepID=A0ABU2YDU1_9FLAO|nr:hypothetical protein [Constantimarinum sp. W242]MDT0556351.1 hypothetical protein [Constantimarinum sp. W242]